MQITIQAKCSLSPTGSHPVTLTFGMSGGRAGSLNSIVNISGACDAADPMVDVAHATGERTCCAVRSAFLDALASEDRGYRLSERFTEALEAGSFEPGVIELLDTALGRGVCGAKQTRERREQNAPVSRASVPAMRSRSERWGRVLDSRLGTLGLKYQASFTQHHIDHTGSTGLGVRFVAETPGQHVAIFAPTGSNKVHVYRTASRGIIGRVKSNPESGKANWCMVCGCAVRGIERHAVSAGHKAVVRRDVFRLARALFPKRVVREVGSAGVQVVPGASDEG